VAPNCINAPALTTGDFYSTYRKNKIFRDVFKGQITSVIGNTKIRVDNRAAKDYHKLDKRKSKRNTLNKILFLQEEKTLIPT
jgi:hypothetical protein